MTPLNGWKPEKVEALREFLNKFADEMTVDEVSICAGYGSPYDVKDASDGDPVFAFEVGQYEGETQLARKIIKEFF